MPWWTDRSAASRIGLSLESYRSFQSQGLKWCHGCRVWHPRTDFTPDRSRGDGLRPVCTGFRRQQYQQAKGA